MYKKIEIHLSKGQAESVAKALRDNQPLNINLSASSLKKKSNLSPLYVTKPQENRINKARKSNSGVVLKLSKAQNKHMKQQAQKGNLKGGFLSAMLPILAASVGSNVISNALGVGGKGAPKTGKGVYLPGSGLYLPGTFKGSGIPLKQFLDEMGCCCRNGKVYPSKKKE